MNWMLRTLLASGAVAVAAASALAAPPGATIGPGGFGTILLAPPDPKAVEMAKPGSRPTGAEGHWYASQHGLTVAEAQARLAAQSRLQAEFQRLNARLRHEERGNYVGAMLRHEPDWAYVFFFKRAPEKTLARYASNSRFLAASAVYSEEDRERLIEPWRKRWQAEGIPFGYGLDAVYPTMEVQIGLTADEWRSLSAERGWGEPPEPIVLKFAKAPVRPAVDPRAAPLLRGFSHERRPTLMQLEALGTGTLKLKDGCLVVERPNGPDQVAVFHMETGIGFDSDGYLALIDRMTGKVRARVGEKLAWGGPNAIPEGGMVGLEPLRAACPGEFINIGNPDSMAVFEARYPSSRTPPPPPPRKF